MKQAEDEYLKMTHQLQKAQFLLSENNRLHSAACNNVENEENSVECTKDSNKETVDNTPCDSEKPTKKKSLPHFMTSTAASRLRHSAAVRQHHFAARVLRSGTRSSMQLSASQSLSFIEPRLKAVLRNENKNVPTETQNSNSGEHPKSSTLSRNKPVTPSLANSRTTFPRHRRRMSNLI